MEPLKEKHNLRRYLKDFNKEDTPFYFYDLDNLE